MTTTKQTKPTQAATRLAGINIISADPLRLADFYQRVLGAQVVNDPAHGGPDRIEIWFGGPDDGHVFITVNRDPAFSPTQTQACQGFELRVSDANAEYARITAMGVAVPEAPRDLPWGYRYFEVKDPDGNGVDLVQAL
ncbi:VOC family protein [Lacticaseibacillus mingshuiensis]|uniref:VOC family protein n=1 Tax=Lacticaseibacillus mingshuiensis TaxID=2799574 RepID=A0ABW4CJU7_9LACO|nr:VOC family protein [Lacticaseibacillus mingshuiensis]